MPGTIVTEDGQELNIDDLEPGTEIEFEDGEIFTVVAADEEPEQEGGDAPYEQMAWEPDAEGELVDADYGKSDDYADMIAKAYNDAVGDDERSAVLAEVAKAAEEANLRADAQEAEIRKMHDQAYLGECIAKADEYGFAGPRTEELGMIIAKAMRVLEPSEIQLLDDIFKSFGELVEETAIGTEAEGVNDVVDAVSKAAEEIVKAAGGEVTMEQAITQVYSEQPDLYTLYREEGTL